MKNFKIYKVFREGNAAGTYDPFYFDTKENALAWIEKDGGGYYKYYNLYECEIGKQEDGMFKVINRNLLREFTRKDWE